VLLRRFEPGRAEEPAAWELLQAEIQAWARLDHPGILKVLDWGRTAAEAFLVMELPPGKPLGSILDLEGSPHDPDEVYVNLLRSVEAARQWGVLHLGLTPANIWVGPDGQVKVGEFGLWYVTHEHPGFGTRDDLFLAPEQVAGERVSAATDVYTLGLLFVAVHHGLDRAREATSDSGLPGELGTHRTVISRCLDPRPLARYRSAGELAEALGLRSSDWEYDDHHDCPVCRLKAELQSGLAPGHQRSLGGRLPARLCEPERPTARGRPASEGDPGHERPTPSRGLTSSGNQGRFPAGYLWLAVAVLAILTILVWFLALK